MQAATTTKYCTLIDKDIRYLSGQNLLRTHKIYNTYN